MTRQRPLFFDQIVRIAQNYFRFKAIQPFPVARHLQRNRLAAVSQRPVAAAMNIGEFAQAAALERSLERRQRDLNLTQGFLRKIQRAAIRQNKGADRLAARAGLEERKLRPALLETLLQVEAEIAKLPRSGRALVRLRRDEARHVLRIIERVIGHQRRLRTLINQEKTCRRQIMKRLRAADALLPLLNDGHLDELEDVLARRRGKGGKNKHAVMLGKLARRVHPYSRERLAELGRKGAAAGAEKRMAAAKTYWVRLRQERSNDGNVNGDSGTANRTGEAAGTGGDAGSGADSRTADICHPAQENRALPGMSGSA